MDILQDNYGFELKEVYLALAIDFDTQVINEWLRTPRTQSFVEQSNSIIKIRIIPGKYIHKSTYWSKCLDVSFYFFINYLIANFL